MQERHFAKRVCQHEGRKKNARKHVCKEELLHRSILMEARGIQGNELNIRLAQTRYIPQKSDSLEKYNAFLHEGVSLSDTQ